MSVVMCGNPTGKYNPDAPGGTYNQILIVPEGYNEGWIKIWEILNFIPSKNKITEEQKIEIINDVNNTQLEEKEIAKYMIETTSSEELNNKIISTIKKLKKREILTLKEIIKTLYTYFVIQNSSENQKRRYAKYEPLKPLKHSDIQIGNEYNYGIKNCLVTIIDIHTDDKSQPYYTVKFTDGKQRQTTLEKLSFI